MKTKNFFRGMFMLAIAGLWTGCANDEMIEPQAINGIGKEISFRVQGGMLRATETTVDNVNAFVVNAYGDITGIAPITKPTLDGITVYRLEGTANTFDYNPKAYFDNRDNNVYFSAYSPVSKFITAKLSGNASNVIAYTVPTPASSGITTQEDLLVAYTAVNPNVATVPMTFKHALSRVFVKAKNTLASGQTVTINEIKLHNLYNAGTLDIDATAWTGSGTFNPAYAVSINDGYKTITSGSAFSDYKKLWIPTGTQNNVYSYVLPEGGVSLPKLAQPAYQTLTSTEQGMLILPQTTVRNDPTGALVEATDFYLELTYSVANLTNNTIKIPYKDLYGIAQTAANEGLTFEFGRQYALNIEFSDKNLNLVEISFTVDVEPWVNPVMDAPLNP